jgi:hypothetical protein
MREADIFVSIPCLLILKSLEDDDKGICKSFMPMMYDEKETVGQKYRACKDAFENGRIMFAGNDYEYYNVMEKFLLDIDYTEVEKKKMREDFEPSISKTVHAIKQMAMEISRYEP